MKHTKGPWVVENNAFPDVKANGRYIVLFDNECPNDAETQANARLIAAAPEMLDMLKLLQTCIELDPVIQRKLDVTGPALDALISRIEGGGE